MYGHDGHMGTQVPIGTGACFESGKPTIVFMGDASAEEDYVLGALGWASTKKLPILFIVEDNNFAITTSKKERRDWSVKNISKAFGIDSFDINDDPRQIYKNLKNYNFKKPRLINIHTNRLFWHAGAGIDNLKTFDRLKIEKKKLGRKGETIYKKAINEVDKIFKKIHEFQK